MTEEKLQEYMADQLSKSKAREMTEGLPPSHRRDLLLAATLHNTGRVNNKPINRIMLDAAEYIRELEEKCA